jgi:hypothetical protein
MCDDDVAKLMLLFVATEQILLSTAYMDTLQFSAHF